LPQYTGARQAESGVLGIGTQQFVEQSAFVVHLGSQPSVSVASNVVQVIPVQQ
jgi:hypothetical protein